MRRLAIALVSIQSVVLLGFSVWTIWEFVNNAFLQVYVGGFATGLLWLSAIMLFLAFLCQVTITSVWNLIDKSVGSNPIQEDRRTDKGETFVSHDDDGPEAHAEPGHVAPTTGNIVIPKESPLNDFIRQTGEQYRLVEPEPEKPVLSKLRRENGRKRSDTDDGGH